MPTSEYPTGPRGTALVTGASHRVGRAIACELARQGFGLLLTYRSRAAGCAETARLAEMEAGAAGHAISVRCDPLDLSDTAAATAFAADIAAAAGDRALDAIVHNASAYEPHGFGSISAADLERMHRVEIVSPLLVTQALSPALSRSPRAGGGAVVLFSDVYTIARARPGFTPYMLAKAAVATLARQLAVELAPAVRVHCVAPGVVMWPDGFPDDAKREILARTPLGRAGTPDEAARLVRFLVLEATFSTGETIAIDGGRALR
jgi:pteridine reductase